MLDTKLQQREKNGLLYAMGNEQTAEQQVIHAPDVATEEYKAEPGVNVPASAVKVERVPILEQTDVKYFGKRWRTDHDKCEIGTISIFTDKTLTFQDSKSHQEKQIPMSCVTGIGECSIIITEYPVTLLIISYNDQSSSSKNSKSKPIEAAFLLPANTEMWLEVLHYQTNLDITNYVHTPECPICLMEAEEYTYLVSCNHMICQMCLFNYIKSQIKDASKYPMRCFNFKCDAFLDMNDVQFAFAGLPDANILAQKEENGPETDEEKQAEEKQDEKEDENHGQPQNFPVLCICGKEMERLSENPYPKPSENEDAKKKQGNPLDGVICDVCLCPMKDTFYHCSTNKEEEKHPDGYDLCLDCSEVRQQTSHLKQEQIPVCECGDPLTAMLPTKCYGGSKNGVVCNDCNKQFKEMIIWHCSKTFEDPHKNGFDLCLECALKHTPEYKEQENKEAVDEAKDQLEINEIEDVIANNKAPEINYAKPTTKQDYTAIYNKFSVLCAMPENERDQCPKCEMIFFGEPRLKTQNLDNWVREQDAKYCANKKCSQKFKIFGKQKFRCTLCGEVFCESCRKYKLELAKGSDAAQQKYIATERMKKHKANLSLFDNIGDALSKMIKSDEEVQQEELEFERKELERATSEEKKTIIENAIIDCCECCWLQYYRGLCGECNFEYCLECRQEWHPDKDCVEEKRMKESKEFKDQENEKLNEEFFKEQGFVKCPRCGVVIEKTSGCNAIPHKCKLKNETKFTNIYVCHCCGEYLKDHDHEKDGTNHFPDGPFDICRKKKGKK